MQGLTASKPKQRKKNQNNLYLLMNLISKDFKLKYRRSVLGVAWSMLNPLLMMIVMVLIFSNIFRFQFDMYPFAVYLILGQTIFSIFQDGTNGAMGSIIEAAPLIKKVRVAKMVFPTEKVLFTVVNFFFSLIAVAAVLVFFGMIPSWKTLAAPVLVLLLTVFTLGVGYLLSSLSVFFRDVMHLWGVLMTVWFYFTPIFWPYDALAGNGLGWVYTLVQFNPMYHFVSAFRQMVTGIPLPSDLPLSTELGLCAVFAAVTFTVGFLVFKKLEKKFILYV
ncbi:ABC transporter permease [Gordonibacter massiliensis (ex Traore et al. 2017)]|uniref:ABC transporter permease n=1 Tax=Gordonibacter massiliensis (ex Traore et al. 2017) TaxID=1841863 RepID=UPI001C8BDEBC|nr:ABC transporter permease [Gordonibacter massiliensis (ex Traore et al. 2017)]MBX9033653.1 ABC transporter permease [Gordonibacter massiliensis (ex Traore et al. 2017)]